ncbi:hypothetical protein E8E13_000989 [Curvularia kusanoi]|uniref:Uncharacterized protein n=1 Tax=Curvularia kusanoi TaxID=90978 RepID=A0A9P4T9Z9_CURKU|nr:hypothetical protein E8E13_000989 [Curvularia kusanoi]
MSFGPYNREFSDSIEYSPVSNEHTHDDPCSRSDNGRPFDDNSTNAHVKQNAVPPSNQKSVGYKGPDIVGWPATPRKINGLSVPLFLGDVALVLFPIAFIVLGISAWILNGKQLSKAGSAVESAMNLGPTIYPLAFAAIGNTHTVYYSDHDAPINPDETTQWLNIVPAVLYASLASSQEAKDLPVDLWSHPKVPRLDAIEQLARDSSMHESSWIDLNTTAHQKYSSWAGINVQNLNKTGTTEFQVKYNYLYVDCEVLFRGTTEDVWKDMMSANLTMYPQVPTRKDDGYMENDFLFEINEGVAPGLSIFLQVAQPSNSSNKFRNDTAHAGFETIHEPLSTSALFQFIHWLPPVLEPMLDIGTNPFDDWIAGSNITFRGPVNRLEDTLRSADGISDNVISERLTTIINTFYQATAWGPQITRSKPFEVPRYNFEDGNDTISAFTPEQWMNITEAVSSVLIPTYKADVGWIVTLLLITIILLLLGVLNIIISFLTVAPDLFYYASSLVRENPYTDTPDGGTGLDGAERSRLLRSMKVQIADVSPEHKVGYVVLKSLGDDDDFSTGRLKKNRLYW